LLQAWNGQNGSAPVQDYRNGSKRGSNENLNSLDLATMSSPSSMTSLAATAAAKLTNGVGHGHHSNGSAVGGQSNGDLDYMEKMDAGIDEKKSSGGGGGGGKSSNNSGLPRDTSKRSRDSSKMTKEDQLSKMESDLKKLKVDLQVARNKENELRDQIVSSAASKKPFHYIYIS
jgi:hypothetical protein